MQNQKESKSQRNPKPHSLVQNPRNRMEEGKANKYSHMSNPRNAITKGKQNLIKKTNTCSLKIPDIPCKRETVNTAQIHSNHTDVVSNTFNVIKREPYTFKF